MTYSTRFFFAIIFLTLVSGCAVNFDNETASDADTARISIGDGIIITAEVATTPMKMAKGLGGRDSLPSNGGMLFPLNESGISRFWMKDMLIPLDFIWISDGKVSDTRENVPVHDEAGAMTTDIMSGKPADYVLEVSAGFVEKNEVTVGEEVEITINF